MLSLDQNNKITPTSIRQRMSELGWKNPQDASRHSELSSTSWVRLLNGQSVRTNTKKLAYDALYPSMPITKPLWLDEMDQDGATTDLNEPDDAFKSSLQKIRRTYEEANEMGYDRSRQMAAIYETLPPRSKKIVSAAIDMALGEGENSELGTMIDELVRMLDELKKVLLVDENTMKFVKMNPMDRDTIGNMVISYQHSEARSDD